MSRVLRLDVMSRTPDGLVPFRVVYVPAGVDGPDPADSEDYDQVAFFDLRYDQTPDGQFVSWYRADTLIDGFPPNTGWAPTGLNLDGGIPSWTVDGDTMNSVVMPFVRYAQRTYSRDANRT